ncbi:MAG: hypothetical protein JNL21_01155 [Myxococcales bacterium]|nr:hypothetical protein [Myxococcales bacterium]
MRPTLAILGLLAAAGSATLAGSCGTDLGALPARCPDGQCPEGYDCINGVCAEPGTAVPITVARVGYLLGRDLRVVPQKTSALVTWQTYAYSSEGESIVGVRVFPDGSVTRQIVLEDTWIADAGSLEPYYEPLAVSEDEILVAIASSPLGDDPRPRLGVFSAKLPPEGDEGSTVTRKNVWGEEVLMSTIGYGAVSTPYFARLDGGAVQLGYFQTVSDLSAAEGGGGVGGGGGAGGGGGEEQSQTLGQLAVFDLDATGAFLSPPTPCPVDASDCCPANTCVEARAGLPLAVGVVGAFPHASGVTWIIDDTRPSALTLGPSDPQELELPLLSSPLAADESGVLLLEPSARQGDQLPTDPVEGPASFGRFSESGTTVLSRLPGVRDTPRPAWFRREGNTAILVTPGTKLDGPELIVYTVDETLGDAVEAARIKRFSSLPITAVHVVVVSGKLFVVWLEQSDNEAVIRAAVLAEP